LAGNKRAIKVIRKDSKLHDQTLIQTMESFFKLNGIYKHTS
jgi:hypothetical protein